ncbi:DinB family protein [Chloroflexota bacterium]
MDWVELLADGYERILAMLEHTLTGLSGDDLKWQPHPEGNSIGWLAWHLTRLQDDHIASLMGEEQLWTKDKWCARFNRSPDDRDIGFGNSPAQVTEFRPPPAEVLLAYHRSVLERTKRYFTTLTNADLDRVLNEPWFQPLPTAGVRLISVLADSLQHTGQMAYIRGLRQGKGWQKY